MRAHKLTIVGKSTYSPTPEDPLDLVNKQYVDSLFSQTAGEPPVFITDVTPQSTGIVGLKQYVPNTVPTNVVVTNAVSDTANVRIHFIAEAPASSYSPVITGRVGNGSEVTAQYMIQMSGQTRVFQGYVNLTVSVDSTVTITSSTGATATVAVVAAFDGPEATAFTIGTLPGSQTEVKSGDVVPVSGTAPNSATSLTIQDFGAASSGNINSLGAVDSAGAGFRTFSGTMTVSSRTGSLNARIVAYNVLGTAGDPVTSSNAVTLNQTFPTIGTITVTYPGSQLAIKSGDSATLSSTITNADTVAYTSSANLSVASPNTYAASKTVSYVSGTYVYNTNNYTITATKASNGAVSTAQKAVNIANVAPTAAVTIVGSPARLRSSAVGEQYEVRVTPNQILLSAPTLDLPTNGGTWSGSWTLVSNYWRRYIIVNDAQVRGTYSYQNVVLPSLSGNTLDGSTLTSGGSYTIGGFLEKILTFAAFERYHAIGTTVGDITKTRARYVGDDVDLTRRTDTNNVSHSFTISNGSGVYSATGGYLFLSDLDFANSNTTGTLQVAVEETP